jgi:predicted TIM-barrel fold metal-dependent hydrolase
MTPYAQALIAARPDRIIWGTDWPHPALDGKMPNDGDLFDMLAVWEPDEARRRAILVDNPERLFGFDPV